MEGERRMTVTEAMAAAVQILPEARPWIRKTAQSFDDEIVQTLAACLLDLQNSGVVLISADDPLILQAAKFYLKSHFGYDADSEKWGRAYEHLKAALSLFGDYNRRTTDG